MRGLFEMRGRPKSRSARSTEMSAGVSGGALCTLPLACPRRTASLFTRRLRSVAECPSPIFALDNKDVIRGEKLCIIRQTQKANARKRSDIAHPVGKQLAREQNSRRSGNTRSIFVRYQCYGSLLPDNVCYPHSTAAMQSAGPFKQVAQRYQQLGERRKV